MREKTSPQFFESLYAERADPWDFAASTYEQLRYNTIVAALSGRRYGRAFEPGCSIGILTAKLATLCDQIIGIDLSSTAIEQAKENCRVFANVDLRVAGLPGDLPEGNFDLIVFSEIGYYFEQDELIALGRMLADRLECGGTLLAAHWLGQSQDHILGGERVHQIIDGVKGLQLDRYELHAGFHLSKWIRQ